MSFLYLLKEHAAAACPMKLEVLSRVAIRLSQSGCAPRGACPLRRMLALLQFLSASMSQGPWTFLCLGQLIFAVSFDHPLPNPSCFNLHCNCFQSVQRTLRTCCDAETAAHSPGSVETKLGSPRKKSYQQPEKQGQTRKCACR